MAESAVSLMLGKLGSFIVEEAESLRGVEAKAQWIKDELERINSFLRVADEISETNPQLKVWVKQVRDIAYDIEDALDRFMLGPPNGFYGLLPKFSCSSSRNTIHCHQLASSIKAIESRVKEVSDGQKVFDSMILKNTSGQSPAATTNSWQHHQADALWFEEAELVGIEKNRKQLIQWLVEDNNLQFDVISVVGMGGLGKTTLAKNVYDQVKMHFRIHAWVTVSQPFNLKMLLQEIAHMIEMPFHIYQGCIALYKIIKDLLREMSYIIVLDNVCKIEHWDAIRYLFPHDNNGCRVMITTRDDDVAKGASKGSKGKVLTLEPLSSKDSAALFCRKTFQEDICPDNLKDIAEHILERCKGLPLAIVAISGLLANKTRRDEWVTVKDNLGGELEGNYMSKILLLSYYDLPYYLKASFLYLSAFPEGYVIKCKRLVRLWVAEGFVEQEEGKILEEVAMSYLNQLVSRGLIQVVRTDICDGRVRECRIHDLVRELIILMSEEQNFMTVVGERNMLWPEKARRLSVLKSMDETEIKAILPLRSLLVFEPKGFWSGKTQSYFLIPEDVRLLRVLDVVSELGVDIFTGRVGRQTFNQYNLRYLSVKSSSSEIPNSIGRLRKLETLDLKGENFIKLPTQILKLEHLRHLLFVSSSGKGFLAVPGVGCLQHLQTLYTIDLSLVKEEIVEELGKLKQLGKLGVKGLREEQGPVFWSSIENLDQLRNLSVQSLNDHDLIDLRCLSSPLKFLERLHLRGYLQIAPQCLSSLHNLIKLSLCWTRLTQDHFYSLQSLPKLISLTLSNEAFMGETLCFKAASLKKLRFLSLRELSDLRQVIIGEGALSSLEELTFDCCKCVQRVPSGIQQLTNLKSLTLVEPSQDLINSIDRSKGGEDYNKVQNIPIIRFKFSKWGIWTNLPREA
ncbi:Disease resistance protein [Corchorus capsularis]|uniref:Disease resistance protein n=1 Tax=Corchorus capsularis TaxID=210143 RepID=A0A1R3G468_COCAP|nr:Disease resistance protein [Corchorus capsularis]